MNSGSLAIFTAIHRASSFVSNLAGQQRKSFSCLHPATFPRDCRDGGWGHVESATAVIRSPQYRYAGLSIAPKLSVFNETHSASQSRSSLRATNFTCSACDHTIERIVDLE